MSVSSWWVLFKHKGDESKVDSSIFVLNSTLMTDLQAKFIANFITDDRYLFIWRGLITTLQITFFAVILGIALGLTISLIRSTYAMTGRLKILNFLCNVYLTLIRGTPAMIQLMILYYIVFASSNNKVLVAVLAFGINSGAYVAEIFRAGIMSIDKGQMEAGRSLGFSFFQTMCYIIMPQAFKNVLPALGNEMIVLLKETAICGYVAIQDLTKGGDIIRSRTYDAYMPLLAVAAIYLIIVVFMTAAVNRLERRLRNSDH